MTIAELEVLYKSNHETVLKGFAEIDRGLQNLGPPAASSLSNLANIATAAVQVGGVLKRYVIDPLYNVGEAAVSAGIKLEQSRIGFETMMGSAKEADRFIRDLQKFAAETPFEFTQLQQASQLMMGMGFQAKELIPTLRIIGDHMAGMGRGNEAVERATFAFGQMKAAGQVFKEDLNQLTQVGIPATLILQEKLGLTAAQIADIGSQHLDSAIAMEAIFQGMVERTGGAMEKQAEKGLQVFSGLSDAINQMLATIGQKILPAVQPVVEWLALKVQDIQAHIDDIVLQIKVLLGMLKLIPGVGGAVGALEGMWATMQADLERMRAEQKTEKQKGTFEGAKASGSSKVFNAEVEEMQRVVEIPLKNAAAAIVQTSNETVAGLDQVATQSQATAKQMKEDIETVVQPAFKYAGASAEEIRGALDGAADEVTQFALEMAEASKQTDMVGRNMADLDPKVIEVAKEIGAFIDETERFAGAKPSGETKEGVLDEFGQMIDEFFEKEIAGIAEDNKKAAEELQQLLAEVADQTEATTKQNIADRELLKQENLEAEAADEAAELAYEALQEAIAPLPEDFDLHGEAIQRSIEDHEAMDGMVIETATVMGTLSENIATLSTSFYIAKESVDQLFPELEGAGELFAQMRKDIGGTMLDMGAQNAIEGLKSLRAQQQGALQLLAAMEAMGMSTNNTRQRMDDLSGSMPSMKGAFEDLLEMFKHGAQTQIRVTDQMAEVVEQNMVSMSAGLKGSTEVLAAGAGGVGVGLMQLGAGLAQYGQMAASGVIADGLPGGIPDFAGTVGVPGDMPFSETGTRLGFQVSGPGGPPPGGEAGIRNPFFDPNFRLGGGVTVILPSMPLYMDGGVIGRWGGSNQAWDASRNAIGKR